MEDTLKQAKMKALRLLTDMDRTEAGLRLKLKQKFSSDEIVDQAIDYVKSFGYINDAWYAERFVETHKSTKSKREMYAALLQKGVEQYLIEQAMENCYGSEDEIAAIQKLVKKRGFSPENSEDAEKKKLYGYLMRKGFQHDSIMQVLQVSSRNA